jgi:hypothetical protein
LSVLSMKDFGRRPLPIPISSIVQPDATDRSAAKSASRSLSRALSSRCLISSQLVALAATTIVFHPHQHPTSMQVLAVELEFQVAGLERSLRRLVAFGHPVSAAPKLNRPAAVLPLGNRALEVAVLERVIFHFDGETLFARIERRAARHRPRFENAVQLKAEVVVQPRGRVLLYYEAPALRGRDCGIAAWLSGFCEIAFGAVP